ncbi:hypothetical protein ACTSKR_11515 [Chitinibacteraceae bacterium HSL-7]
MTRRKHADLIIEWANDDQMVIEIERIEGGWVIIDDPRFQPEFNYRKALTKPSIDWSHVAPEWKWLATHKNGDSYLHNTEPRIDGSAWAGTHFCISAKNFASFKPGTCDWRDSLVMRPEGE